MEQLSVNYEAVLFNDICRNLGNVSSIAEVSAIKLIIFGRQADSN